MICVHRKYEGKWGIFIKTFGPTLLLVINCPFSTVSKFFNARLENFGTLLSIVLGTMKNYFFLGHRLFSQATDDLNKLPNLNRLLGLFDECSTNRIMAGGGFCTAGKIPFLHTYRVVHPCECWFQ